MGLPIVVTVRDYHSTAKASEKANNLMEIDEIGEVMVDTRRPIGRKTQLARPHEFLCLRVSPLSMLSSALYCTSQPSSLRHFPAIAQSGSVLMATAHFWLPAQQPAPKAALIDVFW
jgi:hypothetical protein